MIQVAICSNSLYYDLISESIYSPNSPKKIKAYIGNHATSIYDLWFFKWEEIIIKLLVLIFQMVDSCES
jgi:hypothetical protein